MNKIVFFDDGDPVAEYPISDFPYLPRKDDIIILTKSNGVNEEYYISEVFFNMLQKTVCVNVY